MQRSVLPHRQLNEAHLALLKLKLAGIRAFSNYAEFWQFFGEAASPSNIGLYRERLRPWLDPDTRAYWDKRNVIGRPRHAYFTDGFYRHGMLGRFIGLAHKMARLARIDLAALLNGKRTTLTVFRRWIVCTGFFIRRWRV